MKHPVSYIAAAAAIAVAVWATIGAPLPTHPDGGLVHKVERRWRRQPRAQCVNRSGAAQATAPPAGACCRQLWRCTHERAASL